MQSRNKGSIFSVSGQAVSKMQEDEEEKQRRNTVNLALTGRLGKSGGAEREGSRGLGAVLAVGSLAVS